MAEEPENGGGVRLREYALTAGELGGAATQTVIVVLLPVLLARYRDSAFWVGLAVGGEGVFALFVPFLVGALSDHLPPRLADRFGRRSFFLLLATPLMAATVALVPFLDGYWRVTLVAFLFFVGLHAYMTPLWALMIDDVPDARRGRVQGARGAFRAAGLAYGLVGAGLLFSLWEPLPFLLGALVLLVSVGITLMVREKQTAATHSSRVLDLGRVWAKLKKNPGARRFLLANALWNGAIDGIRPYFFLFAKKVVDVTVARASLALSALIVGLGVGSWVVGWLGDRYARGRILQVSVAFLTVAMFGGFFMRTQLAALFLLLAGGLGAAAIVTLPYPIFSNIMGEEGVGENTGLFVFSVSLGRVLSPMIVGGAIEAGALLMPKGDGYPFMWPTAGLFAAGSLWALHSAMKAQRERGGAEANPTNAPGDGLAGPAMRGTRRRR